MKDNSKKTYNTIRVFICLKLCTLVVNPQNKLLIINKLSCGKSIYFYSDKNCA